MKNIQVIDGALNCTYSLFAATEKEFAHLFPGQTDVAFADELFERLGEQTAARLLNALRNDPSTRRRRQESTERSFISSRRRNRCTRRDKSGGWTLAPSLLPNGSSSAST
jgi:hypothetical protein